MSEGIWIAVIGASGVTLAALIAALTPALIAMRKERNEARAAERKAATDAAVATALLEARTTQAEATVTDLKAEIARKDGELASRNAELASCDQARTELRQLLIACQRGL